MKEAHLGTRLLRHWRRRARDDFADVFKLKLFVTRRCNLRCLHCGIGDASGDTGEELSAAQIARIWTQSREVQVLSLSGGEPFLREDLVEVASSAARAMPGLLTLSVNTNGWYVEETVAFARAVAPRLGARCRLEIAVSSDGPPSAHARVRGSAEAYQRKEETLLRLRRLRNRLPALRVRHSVNINPWNLGEIAEYIETCEARGQRVTASLFSCSSHYRHREGHRAELRTFRERLRKERSVLARLRRTPDLLQNRFFALAEDSLRGEPRQPLPCFSLRASAIVEPDGVVRPCINYPVDLGRIQDHGYSLRAIADSPLAARVRGAIRRGTCPVCWTPNEAYVTLACNLLNPRFWTRPTEVLARLRIPRARRVSEIGWVLRWSRGSGAFRSHE